MMQRSTPLQTAGLAQLATSVVLLSSAFPVTKVALDFGAAPLWFAFGRAGLGCVTAGIVLAAMRRLHPPRRADLPAVLAVGLLQLALFFALSHVALAYVPAGRSSILSNATTIWIAPLTVLVLHEPISARRWLAAGLGVLGTLVLIGPWSIDWHAPGVLLGHFFLLGAALAFAVAMIVIRRLPPRSPMLDLLPWCFVLATLVLALIVFAQGEGPGHWQTPAWEAMTYIGFLATPAIGLLLSTMLLGERIGPDLIAGSVLILGGVGLAAWPARR